MKQYENFYSWYMAFITAIISACVPFLYNFLCNTFVALNSWGNLIATIIASVLFVEIANWAAKIAIDNISFVRKLIMGKNYFEGTAIDFSFDPVTNKVLYGTLTRYYYKNQQIYAEANVFDKSGEVIGNFELKSMDFDEHGIKYGFWGIQKSHSTNNHYYGYGEIHFGAREGVPKNYYGLYVDNIDFKEIFFEGNMLDAQSKEAISKNIASRKNYLRTEYRRFVTEKEGKCKKI